MLFFELTARINQDLMPLYDEREARHLARLVIERASGLSRTALLLQNRETVPGNIVIAATELSNRLLAGEPWQYITGEAEFFGRTFAVGPGVLIPRPETELLVELVLQYRSDEDRAITVLDACTGTGCIAHTIALERPDWNVRAFDISPDALYYAEKNKLLMHSNSELFEADILDESEKICMPGSIDILISNPPYIPLAEKAGLATHVRNYEPSNALFVPDQQPLLFYEALAKAGKYAMRAGGLLLLEIHAPLAQDVLHLFRVPDWKNTEIKNDLYGRPRVLKARRML